MNTEELSEVVAALHSLCLAQAGQLTALRTTTDALLATIGVSLSPLVGQLVQHVEALAALNREELEEPSLAAFDSSVAGVIANLRVLQKQ